MVGIIGLGKVGLTRKSIIEQHPSFRLQAICDTHKPDQKQGPDCDFYTDYPDLLNSDVDAVFVATPNKVTPAIVVSALDHGKHVFCEKPLAYNSKEAKKMIKEADIRNLKLKCGFNLRHHPAIIQAKEWVDKNLIGENDKKKILKNK